MSDKNLLFELSNPYHAGKIKIEKSINAEELFGQIVLNKMVGVAYDNIELQSLHAELRKVMTILKNYYLSKSVIFKQQLKYLANILINFDKDYSLLKGSFLSTNIYSEGQRISNDFDILISSENVSALQNLLLNNGFIQGYVINSNEIRSATRKEIIEAKMNFGETIPFVKIIENEPLVIDINFSMDYKMASEKKIITEILAKTEYATFEDVKFKVLNPIDFIIHLSCHLYKEATTYDWVIRRRDLMLYKFCDINVFVRKYGTNEYFLNLVKQIKRYKLEKECYYTFENSSIIYPELNDLEGFESMKESIKPANLAFMSQVIYPREKKLFQHDMNFTECFFCPDRVSHLKEIGGV